MIVGLDIGTSKVVAVVGEVDVDGVDRGRRDRVSSLPRDEKRCGGRYRVHRKRHPASSRGSRADGGLPDSLGLCWDRWKPHSVDEFPWHRGN